jgi:WD40 repeat protein
MTSAFPGERRLPVSVIRSAGPLRFNPDATQIAIANINGRGDIGIVDASSGRTLTTLVGHSDNVVDLAFSPDGMLLVTGSRDGTARVWDVKEGRLLRTFDHPAPVLGVAFAPDGRTIATMDETGLIHVWDACSDCEDVDALMALAKTRVTRSLTAGERQAYLR